MKWMALPESSLAVFRRWNRGTMYCTVPIYRYCTVHQSTALVHYLKSNLYSLYSVTLTWYDCWYMKTIWSLTSDLNSWHCTPTLVGGGKVHVHILICGLDDIINTDFLPDNFQRRSFLRMESACRVRRQDQHPERSALGRSLDQVNTNKFLNLQDLIL